MKTTFRLLTLVAVTLGSTSLPTAFAAPAAPAVINPAMKGWVDAARTGRADLLIVGDSMTWSQSHGWDAGFTRAAADTLGIAGSGLSPNARYSGEGEGYATFGSWNGWSESAADAPPGKRKYAWRDTLVTAGASPVSAYGWNVTDDTGILDPQAALQMQVWHDSPGNGTLGSYKRRNDGSTQTVYTGPTAAVGPKANGLTKSILNFPAEAAGATGDRDFLLGDTTKTSIFYSRLLKPQGKGVTVSSWGLGGKSTYDFHQMYTSWDKAGREAWLNALVDSGSGKLNVVIAEGFNDRHEKRTSLGGNPNGSSPDAFADNVRGLMSVIRSDWVDAGMNDADLSFLLLGMYDIDGGEDPQLVGYAQELREIAIADPRASFINLRDVTPTFAEGQAAGYFADGLHLSREGALAYSRAAMNVIVPEPTLLGPALLLPFLAARRRRR